MRSTSQGHAPRRRAQAGYTLIELSIAIIIALFLTAGLVTLVMHARNASNTQNQLAQLQDDERIALTLMTNVIQQAGYFPDPTTNTAAGSLGAETSAVAGSFAAAQAVMGQSDVSASGDVVAARFVAPKADAAGIIANSVITCAGTTNSDTGAIHTFTNVFQIASVGGVSYLQCILSRDGVVLQTVNLVPGLQDMQVLYGVATGGDDNVTKYVAASAMQPSDWLNITAVKVRLYFQLPQYGFSGGQVNSAATAAAMANGTQYVERVIGLMNRAGVNT